MGADWRETGTEFRKNLRKGVYKRGGSVQNVTGRQEKGLDRRWKAGVDCHGLERGERRSLASGAKGKREKIEAWKLLSIQERTARKEAGFVGERQERT